MKIAACSVVCALLCAVLKPHEGALALAVSVLAAAGAAGSASAAPVTLSAPAAAAAVPAALKKPLREMSCFMCIPSSPLVDASRVCSVSVAHARPAKGLPGPFPWRP